MKRFFSLALLSSILFAGLSAKAQTADEIIAKHITAIGGMDNLKKIQSAYIESSIQTAGLEFPIKQWIVNEKAMRAEFEVMGTSNITVITANDGWKVMPVQNIPDPVKLTSDEVKNGQDQLDLLGDLVDYKRKGSTVELKGKETIEGKDMYVIKLINKDKQTMLIYLDAATYYVTKRVVTQSSSGQEVETKFSNYTKTPAGIVYPYQIDIPATSLTIVLNSIEFNKPVDEKIFAFPGK